jgi:hypothetical protein
VVADMRNISTVLLMLADFGCFAAAIYIYFFGGGDAAEAVFWLALSISAELSWQRAVTKL